jgi:hypothetical protein
MAGLLKKIILKILLLLIFPFIAQLIAGGYGALHNQISYTVSSEYFTLFKFNQFHLQDNPSNNRIKAAIVGYRASAWMGFYIGIFIGLSGLVQKTPKLMALRTVEALGIVAAVTLFVGLIGLLRGYIITSDINLEGYQNWYIPYILDNLRRFLCAGHMHNSSYLGGVIGIPFGIAFQIYTRVRRPLGTEPASNSNH